MSQCLATSLLLLPLHQTLARLYPLRLKLSPVHLVIPPLRPLILLRNKINLSQDPWTVLKRLHLPHHQRCLRVQHRTPHLWPLHLSNASSRPGRRMVPRRPWLMLKALPQNGTQEKRKGGQTRVGQGSVLSWTICCWDYFFLLLLCSAFLLLLLLPNIFLVFIDCILPYTLSPPLIIEYAFSAPTYLFFLHPILWTCACNLYLPLNKVLTHRMNAGGLCRSHGTLSSNLNLNE